MTSLLKYPGGKWRISDWIISHFPEHKVYCEPFFGSGAVFFNKQPCYVETINDMNGDIVNLFEVCRNHPEELARAISLTPYARDEFINCNTPSDDPIEQARRTIVRYHQSFGTSNSSKNSWRNVQTYGGPRCATMWNYLPEAVKECCERLKDAQIENTDALTLIERYDDENTLIYLDPPYLPELRKKNIYKCEMDKDKSKYIELPCKVGDTVYCYNDDFECVLPYFVENINIGYYSHEKTYISFEANSHADETDELLDDIDFDVEDIGKTVFLTKTEAEAKLKELLNDN